MCLPQGLLLCGRESLQLCLCHLVLVPAVDGATGCFVYAWMVGECNVVGWMGLPSGMHV